MHHTQALKTLLQCLEDLTGTVESFGQEQNLHDVEKDLVLYRGRLLYEAILKLPTEAAQAPEIVVEQAKIEEPEPAEVQASPEVIAAPAAMAEPELTGDADEESELPEDTQFTESPQNVPEENANPEIEINRLTITLENVSAPANSTEQTSARIKAIQLEHFSISEVLRQSGDKDLILTHLKLKPIQDLKSGIGLNEKFLFIRELFENDHQAYADAVEALNNSTDLDQAEGYIANELLPRYGWELEKEALLNFLHLILRRFSNS